jgi:hypothetical protein
MAFALTACANMPVLPTIGEEPAPPPFSQAQVANAWVAPAGGILAMDRQIGAEREQIVGLVNDTALPGDNFLWLRARATNRDSPGRFMLNDLVSRVGGIPPPFTGLSDRDLHSGSDSLGPFFWLEYRAGETTNCVLAIRRTDASRRILPAGTNMLEIMLRNCIQGSIETALNPIRDSQIGVGAPGANLLPNGGSRMLSPLAAPMPSP